MREGPKFLNAIVTEKVAVNVLDLRRCNMEKTYQLVDTLRHSIADVPNFKNPSNPPQVDTVLRRSERSRKPNDKYLCDFI